MIRRSSPFIALVVVVLAGVVVAGLLLAESRGTIDTDPPLRDLTKPLRLRVGDPASVARLLEGLRVNHYRAQRRSEASFRDVFYDTEDGRLAAAGYSYRFRKRLGRGAGTPYAVRLEREPRFVPAGESKLDLRSELPVELGDAIDGGAWARGVTGGEGLGTPDRLRALLKELGVEVGELGPRLVADVRRDRYEVTDKGRTWFELDHERWSFGVPGGEPRFSVEDLVLDTRVSGQDPELGRRVRTMDMLVTDMLPFAPVDRAPHERARAALLGE